MDSLVLMIGMFGSVILGYLMGYSRGQQTPDSPIPLLPAVKRLVTPPKSKPGIVTQATPEQRAELNKTPDEREVDEQMIKALEPYLGDPRKDQ